MISNSCYSIPPECDSIIWNGNTYKLPIEVDTKYYKAVKLLYDMNYSWNGVSWSQNNKSIESLIRELVRDELYKNITFTKT